MCIFIKAIFAFIKRNKTGRKSIASTVISALLSMLLLGTAMMPAFLFADYKGREVTGSYKIAQTEAILVDESRGFTIPDSVSKDTLTKIIEVVRNYTNILNEEN